MVDDHGEDCQHPDCIEMMRELTTLRLWKADVERIKALAEKHRLEAHIPLTISRAFRLGKEND